jgi:anaerobic selenocysteine-containing dehydrogenase
MKEFITVCPRNCYSTCTFRVQIENNTIKRILPFSGNLATPEGPCIKGLSYIERSKSVERITSPLLRSTNGKFYKISMNEALELISDKLQTIKERYGSKSIFWYHGSGMAGLTNEIGHSFWKLFGGVTVTYGNLCWPAGLEAIHLTLGDIKHNVPWDLENARVLIIWGKNPAETNIQEISFIVSAREKGCKVIVVDPRRTPTADKADILIQPTPGTDAALALAIAQVLIADDLVDKEFVKNYVSGFDEFKQSLTINPDDAEKITGVPKAVIIELAHLIGTNGPVTFLPGYGLQRYTNGGQTIRSILTLCILTGNLGKPGAGFNYANLQSYIYDNPKEPLSYYPNPVDDAPFRRSVSMALLGKDMLGMKDPELKVAWIERGNPMLQSPDSKSVAKAFSKMEFKVVVDQFMTDTAILSDLILPAKDMFEQSDIIGSYWSPYIQFKPKVLDPECDIIPESEIYYHLAKNMGFEFDNSTIPEPGNENIEKWLDNRIKGPSSLSLEDLRNGPVLAPGIQEIAYADMKFKTPSGKIELYSGQAKSKWNIAPLPMYVPINKEKQNGIEYHLVLMTPNAGSRIHSQFGNLEIIKQVIESPAAEMSFTDAETRNIISGDKIRIYNQKGSIESIARVTGRIPAGCLVLNNGIWLQEGGGGNFLIESQETDIGFGAAFHGNRVEVEKVNNE